MINNNITIGTKIESKGMTMVVTGENVNYYLGYIEYKGKNCGESLLAKSMFTNPHYMGTINIVEATILN